VFAARRPGEPSILVAEATLTITWSAERLDLATIITEAWHRHRQRFSDRERVSAPPDNRPRPQRFSPAIPRRLVFSTVSDIRGETLLPGEQLARFRRRRSPILFALSEAIVVK